MVNWKTARWAVVAVCALPMCAFAQDAAAPVKVLGVTLEWAADGRLEPLTEQRRRAILEQLRAAYAARGVAAHSGALRIAHDGEEALEIGLDHTSITVARVNADGGLDTLCVKGAAAAAAFLAQSEEQ